jgi:hypothetical protein
VGVERRRVGCAAAWSEFSSSGEERLDGPVSENKQGSDRPEARGLGLIAPGLADALHDLLAAELLEVVGGAGGTVLCRGLPAERTNTCRERGRGEAVGGSGGQRNARAASADAVKPSGGAADNAMIASATQRMRGLLRSMPPTVTLPTWDAVGKRSSV